jgi:hypothetical protein
LTIQLIGDEFFHYSQTTDGLLIQQNGDGVFEYTELNNSGTLMLSGIKANDVTKRTEKEFEFTKKLKDKRVKEIWLNTQQIKFPNSVKHNSFCNRDKKGSLYFDRISRQSLFKNTGRV